MSEQIILITGALGRDENAARDSAILMLAPNLARDENNAHPALFSSKRGESAVMRIPDVMIIGARPTGAPDYSRQILITDFRHVKPPYYVRGGFDDKTAGVA